MSLQITSWIFRRGMTLAFVVLAGQLLAVENVLTASISIGSDGKVTLSGSTSEVSVNETEDGLITFSLQNAQPVNGPTVKSQQYLFKAKHGVRIACDGYRWTIKADETSYGSVVISNSKDTWDASAQLEVAFCYWDFFLATDGGTKWPELEKHRDVGEAFKWVSRAAIYGDARAQYFLGRCFQFGWGVEKDPAGAVKLYTKSAEQGYEGGQFALGLAYLEGIGVPRDEVEAYAYLNLAGVKNEKIRALVTNIESGMSSQARLMGQQRSRQIKREIEERKESSEEAIKSAKKPRNRLGA